MQIKQHKQSVSEAFLLSHITGLLAFARNNDTYAESLAAIIQTQSWTTGGILPTTTSRFTTPAILPQAVQTTHWILNTLQTHPEHIHARGVLATWAQNYESPRNLVLGIVGMAIIGPTLGIISSKKKKKQKLQLVMEKTYYEQLQKEELAILTTSVSQAVIAHETRIAGGNVYNLHPDSAAWCLEEAITAVYTDTAENIQTLVQAAKAESLSHTTQADANGNIQILAISPCVNDTFIEESEAEPA